MTTTLLSSAGCGAVIARLASLLSLIALLLVSAAQRPSAQQPTPQAPLQTPAAKPDRPSAMSGVVTDASTGRLIAGASVSVVSSAAKVSVGMLTDSKGRYVFTDLPPSPDYILRVRKSGYYNLGRAKGDPLESFERIRIVENEWRQHEDLLLWPMASLSGTVVDEQGERVVGAPVRVWMQKALGGSVRWLAGPMATTDDRGVYRVEDLQQGTYVVLVPNVQPTVPPATSAATAAGLSVADVRRGVVIPPALGLNVGGVWLTLGQYAIPPPVYGHYRAYPTTYFPGSQNFAGAAPITLANGENKMGVDLTLRPVPTASVSGRVIGPPDAVAGMVARLIPADSPVDSLNAETASALLGADGSFTFVGVPAGQYVVTVISTFGSGTTIRGSTFLNTPGLMRPLSFSVGGTAGTWSGNPSDGVPYSARTAVPVGAQNVSDVVVELRNSTRITGRIVNEDGSPLPDMVSATAFGTGDPTFLALWGRVDKDATPPGHFEIRGIPDGDYLLSSGSAAPRSLVVKSITSPSGDFTDRPFHASAGNDLADVLITLTDKPAALTGVVRDRNGSVVTQSAVILFPADRRQWTRFGLSPTRLRSQIAIGPDGYELSRLREGDYLIVATDIANVNAWHDSRFLEAAASVATPVSVKWGGSGVVNLTLRQVTVR